MRKHLVTTAIAVMAAVLLVAPAFAGKGHAGLASASASLTATPNPATVGSHVNVSGCGYQFAPATVQIVHPTGRVESFGVGMWSSGCLDTAYFVPSEPGTYTVQVLQSNGRTMDLLASTSVTVS
jgi:hypothetical protein